MRILQVIHGYPPHYMAGSEVYTYNLCKELARKHDVTVFSRVEDPYEREYDVKEDVLDSVSIIRVNKPSRDYTFRSKFMDRTMDGIFRKHVTELNPDIAHIGHLSHLSTNFVEILKNMDIPILMTLHDFWLICLRGQLLTESLELCEGPTTEGCVRCFSHYFLSEDEAKKSVLEWRHHMDRILRMIDLFIAPSRFLRGVFIHSGIPEDRIVFGDYGFDVRLFEDFKRLASDTLRFGFMGRIIPAKGVHLLIDAFNGITDGDAQLDIYGALPPSARYLKTRIHNPRIRLKGPFENRDIAKILSQMDVLVVPSIWYENSPLVIHEAFLTKTPVIATNLGGMAEYVEDGKNGLLFELGNVDDLRDKLEALIHDRELLRKLSVGSDRVRTIQEDADCVVEIYERLLRGRDEG